jgi:hypothetical protein
MRSKMKFAGARGLTLVEVIVAATLSGIVITALLSVLLQTLKAYSFENGEINVNVDMRKFTNELTKAALPATYFRVLNSYTDLGSGALSRSVATGASGDCVLFVYKSLTDDSKFSKVVAYFRVPDGTNEGAVRRVVVEFSGSGQFGPVDSLIPRISNPPGSYPQVIALARGLGSGGKLFTNFDNRSLLVNGEIIRAPTGQFRRASHAFNFSVTPR